MARDVHRAHPGIARAQQAPTPRAPAALDIQQFQPTPFSDGYLRVDGTAILPRWKLHAGLDLDYAWKPLVLVDVAPSIQRSRKTTYDFIGHAVGAHLKLAMGVGGRFEVGALIPVTVFQTGDAVPERRRARHRRPRQRPRSAPRRGILGSGTSSGPGLGASLLVALPWGFGGAFTHDTTPAVEGRLFGEVAQERWSLRLSGGYRRARGRAALRHRARRRDHLRRRRRDSGSRPAREVLAELDGATSAAHPLDAAKQTPVELLLGGRREMALARWQQPLLADRRRRTGPDARLRIARGARRGVARLVEPPRAPPARALDAAPAARPSRPKPPAARRRRSPTATRTASPTTTTSAPTSPRTRTASRTTTAAPIPTTTRTASPTPPTSAPTSPRPSTASRTTTAAPTRARPRCTSARKSWRR